MRMAARLLGEKRSQQGKYDDQIVQEIMDSVERYEQESDREARNLS